jgi:aryl-alcohol dehydrogenase-like predicted oxidoreductase
MKYNTFGRTGLRVSEICLGTMTYGGEGQGFWSSIGTLGVDETAKHIARAFDAGVNFIDTANIYHNGLTEKLVGEALKQVGRPRAELVLATKVRGRMGEGPNDVGLTRSHIINQLDASLKRLQTDYIDLYQIHGVDPITPLEETLRALDDAVSAGKVRYLGLCNHPAWQIMKALAISEKMGWRRFESVQMYYSIAGRDIEREVIPLAQDQGLAVLPWSPLAGGILSGKFLRDGSSPEGSRRANFDFPPINRERAFDCLDVMREIAQCRDVSVAQLALAWTIQQPAITSIIIGARTMEQLEANLAACDVELSEEELQKLDEVSRLPDEYPGWMVEQQSSDRMEESAQYD